MPAVLYTPAARPLDDVRVTGRLVQPAQLLTSTGQPPHRLLQLHLQPRQGLAYLALADLGTDERDHRAAQALLPQLQPGALVSVGGTELRPRTDHGHAVFTVVGARHVLLLQDPTSTTPQPDATPDLFGAAGAPA